MPDAFDKWTSGQILAPQSRLRNVGGADADPTGQSRPCPGRSVRANPTFPADAQGSSTDSLSTAAPSGPHEERPRFGDTDRDPGLDFAASNRQWAWCGTGPPPDSTYRTLVPITDQPRLEGRSSKTATRDLSTESIPLCPPPFTRRNRAHRCVVTWRLSQPYEMRRAVPLHPVGEAIPRFPNLDSAERPREEGRNVSAGDNAVWAELVTSRRAATSSHISRSERSIPASNIDSSSSTNENRLTRATKTPLSPLVSPGTRLVSPEMKATTLPSADTAPPQLSYLDSVPLEASDTRLVTPVVMVCANTSSTLLVSPESLHRRRQGARRQ